MKQVEIEKDWRVSVASLAFILFLVVGLDFYSTQIVGLLHGIPLYVFAFLTACSLVGAWVLRKIY